MVAAADSEHWRPTPGQIALVEPEGAPPGRDMLTGVVVAGERVTIDLGASPRPDETTCDVVASFYAPDALYRLIAKATQETDGLLTLDVAAVERVQRRAAHRVRLTLPVRLGAAREEMILTGETVDLSTGGCRVMTDRPWPDDREPVLSIDLPDGAAMVAEAKVVTVDLTGGGWEYRLSFANGIAEDDRQRLSRLVALGG